VGLDPEDYVICKRPGDTDVVHVNDVYPELYYHIFLLDSVVFLCNLRIVPLFKFTNCAYAVTIISA